MPDVAKPEGRGVAGYPLKRALDLVIAVPLLILVAPVILLAALAVGATSPGPALFSQQRLGRHERPFQCRKLRTMHLGTAALPTHEVSASAITPLGRLLRRSKLDELPQLWNVVLGQMSLVGPRPCLPSQAALIGHRRELGVFATSPGVTGLAQVNGIDMSDPRLCAETDAQYLRSVSLWLDLSLLVRTVLPRRRRT